jgi:Mg2+ and Co2+ transporter CorA
MNVPLPGAAVAGHSLAWVIILIMSILTAGAMLYYFKRRGWF